MSNSFLKNYLQRKTGWGDTPVPDRRNEPLGLKLNALVDLEETPFLLLAGKISWEFPGEENLVGACGNFRLGDVTVNRFYLVPRIGDGPDEITFLQVHSKDGLIEDAMLFSEVGNIVPKRLEWPQWLDQEEGYIGQMVATDNDGNEYFRAWMPETDGHVPPIYLTENIRQDDDPQRFSRKHQMMLYVREVPESDRTYEYVLFSAEEDQWGARARILKGISLVREFISVNGVRGGMAR